MFKKIILPMLLVGTTFAPSVALADYIVNFNCRISGIFYNHPLDMCMGSSGYIELTENGRKKIIKTDDLYRSYEYEDLRNLGRITVPDSFQIRVQNKMEDSVLSISIKDLNGNEVFRDEVPTYGVINVGN